MIDISTKISKNSSLFEKNMEVEGLLYKYSKKCVLHIILIGQTAIHCKYDVTVTTELVFVLDDSKLD